MKMMGLIFSNIYDEFLGELTKNRTLASLPFGGRYRLIDFVLSNMVSCGITNVGVITKSNYQSLMDHLGKGKEWDLDRKKDGLFILPPFGAGQRAVYKGKLEALFGAVKYLERSVEKYVVLSDSNVICSIDFSKVLEQHIKNEADITVVSRTSLEENQEKLVLKSDDNQRVTDVMINYVPKSNQTCSMGMYILSKELLLKLVYEANSYNYVDFEKYIIQRKYKDLKIFTYKFADTALVINSTRSYFASNMSLLNSEIRNEIFYRDRYVYTKSRDEVPTIYGESCEVKNSFIADGCIIEGTVENSILFRGVKVKKGAVVKNCILMQDTHVGDNAELDYVISDKEVIVTDERRLVGVEEIPAIISKGKVI